MSGTFGPYTSASSRPTLWPSFANAIARFTASVVLPTPPLPEPTAVIVTTPGKGCGEGGCWLGRGGLGELKQVLFRSLLYGNHTRMFSCGERWRSITRAIE